LIDGRIFCWGNNAEGQLAQDDPFTGPGVNSAVPLQVETDADWVSVSCGQGHTCAIRTEGALWCWGRNALGELGLGEAAAGQIRVPQLVGAETDWVMVAAGQNHTCGIRGEDLYCWGGNGHSQSGIIGQDPIYEPTQLSDHSGVAEVGVDTFHSCARTLSGGLSCWGRNIEGQLGDGTIEAKPQRSDSVPADGWDQVSVARFHTCGVRGGVIYCTGENRDGRLGTGDLMRRSEYTETVF
jgi:alpha-tubulin suppressor-like RCC1 family protein